MLVIDITLSPLNRELYNVLVGTDRTQVRETITKHTVKNLKNTQKYRLLRNKTNGESENNKMKTSWGSNNLSNDMYEVFKRYKYRISLWINRKQNVRKKHIVRGICTLVRAYVSICI